MSVCPWPLPGHVAVMAWLHSGVADGGITRQHELLQTLQIVVSAHEAPISPMFSAPGTDILSQRLRRGPIAKRRSASVIAVP